MNTVEIKGLTKKFGKFTAVDGISLEVKEGEIFGLLGPNGAGKTTTLMMLSTLIPITSGTATVNGFNVHEHPDKVRDSIGMVFQDPSSDDILTGYENLKLHALMYNVPMKDINPRIKSALELVELTDRKNDLVRKYSGGMRRRLEIARGLLHNPKILFLDEPTLGLDPQTREHIWNYIKILAKKIKMTIIVTTHYMEEAEWLCDRVAIIDHGKIMALNTPKFLKDEIGGDIVNLQGKINTEELGKLPFVKTVEREDHTVTLAVKDAGKNLQKILKVAGKVDYAEVHTPTLNDVFLHYTGKGIREAEGDEMDLLRSRINANSNNNEE